LLVLDALSVVLFWVMRLSGLLQRLLLYLLRLVVVKRSRLMWLPVGGSGIVEIAIAVDVRMAATRSG
jgi:hypothetical protein